MNVAHLASSAFECDSECWVQVPAVCSLQPSAFSFRKPTQRYQLASWAHTWYISAGICARKGQQTSLPDYLTMSCFSCLPFKSRKLSDVKPKETTLIAPKETPVVEPEGPTFNEFWEEWIIKPPQFDLQLPKTLSESNDAITGTTSTLCEQCMLIVSSSGLLTGSRETFTRRCEWHDWHKTLEDLQISTEKHCHLCTIFWSSIPKSKSCVRSFLQLRVKLWTGSSGGHKTGEDYFLRVYRGGDKLSKPIKIDFSVYHLGHIITTIWDSADFPSSR